ncbi:hypothetical protein FXO38_15983 [Capsicum annuum]|nr:hypothetical protein FXO38_15983 [Capsicum annuum]
MSAAPLPPSFSSLDAALQPSAATLPATTFSRCSTGEDLPKTATKRQNPSAHLSLFSFRREPPPAATRSPAPAGHCRFPLRSCSPSSNHHCRQ